MRIQVSSLLCQDEETRGANGDGVPYSKLNGVVNEPVVDERAVRTTQIDEGISIFGWFDLGMGAGNFSIWNADVILGVPSELDGFCKTDGNAGIGAVDGE